MLYVVRVPMDENTVLIHWHPDLIAPSSLAGVTPANDDGAIKVKVGALMTVIFLMKMNPMKNKLQT